jgi:hypothetical protein
MEGDRHQRPRPLHQIEESASAMEGDRPVGIIVRVHCAQALGPSPMRCHEEMAEPRVWSASTAAAMLWQHHSLLFGASLSLAA